MREQTTIDEAAKLRVKDAMLEHARAELRSMVDNADAERDAGRLGQDESLSVDDISQSDAAGDLEGLLSDSATAQRRTIEQIEALDFTHTVRVAAGAIVGFEEERYVVGVAVGPFECDGVTYEGISTDAPIYGEIEGLRVGDRFSFNGQEHRIDFVA